jgi:Nanos RNA binding domain
MYATSAASASRRALFSNPPPKSQRLNYEGDVKTMFNQQLHRNNISSVMMMKQNQNQKMFCKVCHDAGKPESIYTSHFVRALPALDAPVVCPTLLAQPCRYCSQAGHTVKYCPMLSNSTTMQTTTVRQPPVITKKVNDDFDRAMNRFSALAIDTSDTSSVDEFDEVKNLSLQTLTVMLSSILQMNPRSDNKLVIAIENAIAEKSKSNKSRPPFCSPLPVPPSTDIIQQAQQQQKSIIANNIKSKDWADCDDDEIDFSVDLPNFPPLPPPSLKRSYSEITKGDEIPL